MKNIQGRSWVGLVTGRSDDWRDAWLYEYNYELQFPYTPNVRGIRKGDWKYVAYPHGDGGPLRHMEELYNMARDPGERRNLANNPGSASKLAEMRLALAKLLKASGADPDTMPIDQGIQAQLPEESIR